MKKLRVLVALLLVLWGLRWLACGPARDPGPRPRIANRVWVDKIPEGPRDLVFRLVLVDKGKMKGGFAMVASKYRVAADRLKWKLDRKKKKAKLTLYVTQVQQKVTFDAKTSTCDGPGPYDVCLDLTTDGQTVRLYSHRRATFEADAGAPFEAPWAEGPPEATELDPGVFTDTLPAWFSSRARVE